MNPSIIIFYALMLDIIVLFVICLMVVLNDTNTDHMENVFINIWMSSTINSKAKIGSTCFERSRNTHIYDTINKIILIKRKVISSIVKIHSFNYTRWYYV